MANESGTCRVCGCHGDCRLPDGEECVWFDAGRTVCSKVSCIRAYEARRKEAMRAARPRKLSSAEVHAQIAGRGRKAKKRRAA